MRLHRFYVNKPLGEEIVVESVGAEKEIVHQWIHVFRYQSGNEVILFSSLSPGKDFLYRISAISKQAVTLSPISSSPHIASLSITLAMALVKKDTFETIVRQATELGVSRIIPVLAERSEKKNLNSERLLAIATEAAEQSGRGEIPEISPISSLEETLALSLGENIVGSLHGQAFVREKGSPCTLWVGPEGGWTEKEEAIFKGRGFTFFKCADTVLKADTAAVALLSHLV